MRHAQATFDIDARIRRVATAQLGLITYNQAADCGVDKHALSRRRNAGALVPVFRHVMRLEPYAATAPQHALAAALAVPGSIIAATSAALVHQFPVPTARMTTDNEVLSVLTNRQVGIPGITVVRQTTRPPSRAWMTTRVTTPASTILLLPRFLGSAIVERCLDHCLAHRLVSVDALHRLIANTPIRTIHHRALLLDLLADRSHGIGHRSNTERQVGRWLARAGLTGWTRNLSVRIKATGEFVEVDFGWPQISLGLEVSPFFTHGSRAKQERDAHRRRLLVGVRWRIIEALDDDVATERAFATTIAALRALGAT